MRGAFSLPSRRAGRRRADIIVKVRQNFYMIAGGGGNIGVQIGSELASCW